MRAVIQRVSHASVSIDGKMHAQIAKGLLIFLGIESSDSREDAAWLSAKIAGMRIFSDAEGKMNLGPAEAAAEFLVISQFTLHASTKKGNRPSFIAAAGPDTAIPLYEFFLAEMRNSGLPVSSGVFGADMQVSLLNDGPVTILIDSKDRY